jgi:PTH1 family peptidyl-tRNA hydrolase
MNESGTSVAALMHFYKLTPADVVVVHDDKDIPLGKFRVQKDRGAAGHNGVSSIIEHLGTQDFWRIRIGVAVMDYPIEDTAEFVLGRFSKEELSILNEATKRGLDELKKIL